MSFQNTVYVKQTPGIPGDFADASPRRVATKVVCKNDTVLPTVGCAFTLPDTSTPEKVAIGGTASFAGIFVNSKEQVRAFGLESALTVADNSIGDICTFGHIWVKSEAAVTVGMVGVYNVSTGAISAMVSGGTVAEGYAEIPNSKFIHVNAGTSGMAVLELN